MSIPDDSEGRLLHMVSLTTRAARGAGWVWNLAGADDLLALACKDVEAGHFGVACDALSASRDDFALRASRSAVLASVAADGDVAEHWCREEPGNPDALLLGARVAVVRARRVAGRDGGVFAELAGRAWDRCRAAALVFPADPTPWVAMLALAQVDAAVTGSSLVEGYAAFRKRYEGAALPRWVRRDERWSVQLARHLAGSSPAAAGSRPVWQVAAGLEELLGVGPWGLMFEVWARDPLGREAYRWMVECLPVADAHQFASLIALGTPRGAVTQLLPLVAHVKQYQWLSGRGPASDSEGSAGAVWRSAALRAACLDVYEGWFPVAVRAPGAVPVADLSLLAHTLFQTGELVLAANVLEAMRPFASTYPWSATGGDGEREFLRVARALRVAAPRAMSGWEYRERYG